MSEVDTTGSGNRCEPVPPNPLSPIPARDETELRLDALNMVLRFADKSLDHALSEATEYVKWIKGDESRIPRTNPADPDKGKLVNTTHTKDGFVDVRDAAILLHQYSEFLDSPGIRRETLKAAKAEADGEEYQGRSHDDLVREFLSTRDHLAIPYLEAAPSVAETQLEVDDNGA